MSEEDTPKWKRRCLQLAECHDAWRPITRILLIAACLFVYDVFHDIFEWYTSLPMEERSMEASGLAWGMFTTVSGFVTVFLNAYVKAARKWDKEKAVDSERTW